MASDVATQKKTKGQQTILQHERHSLLKFVYSFEDAKTGSKQLLGGKGAGLAEMTKIGLPVPPGFTVTTEACHYFCENNDYPKGFWAEFDEHLAALEKKMQKEFGSKTNPLLVSVRSGAAISMPGMMDTVLNLGLNDETVEGLITQTNNPRFCWDAYRRFIQMFGDVVLGIDHEKFESTLELEKIKSRVQLDTDLSIKNLQNIVSGYKKIILKETGKNFPKEPRTQLKLAVEAVFRSWNNERAIAYRRINKITGLLGTAVNIQSMAFGNMGEDSGTGVAFTRNPSTGNKEFYGEFLINAQGEDVVAGIRTPQKIEALKQLMPKVYNQLLQIQNKLERHYKNMQDIEFTIEKGRLFILQTRNGKRTAQAAIKIATDMVKEKMISQKDALLQVDPNQLDQLLHPQIKSTFHSKAIAQGLPASPGAAVGKVVFTAEDAVEWSERGEKVILVRKETSPEDIEGMHTAQGILTSMGGMTSHAAVVCRGMGKPCVAGCASIEVDAKKRIVKIGNRTIKEGEIITLNGSTGEVFKDAAPLELPKMSALFVEFMKWADKYRTMQVRTNADTPTDAKRAREFGAEGIGLCRTEHMFFEEDRIISMREMILASSEAGRRKALAKLLPFQRKDFAAIFNAMSGYPVTIRLLDPPLHEFLPTTKKQVAELATLMKLSPKKIIDAAERLHEINPMLGHRGCRLGITYPEIYEMQTRAIVEAGIAATKKGTKVIAEIEIPLVGSASELEKMRRLVEKVISEYHGKITFKIKIGTMIELPRACLTADEICEHADFFSFGTNDLTQTTFGFSRDDAGKFMQEYLQAGILERDPTESIDRKGVGELMKLCIRLARSKKTDFEMGICGEHGGEPKSVEFCHEIGLNYVSCSPFRLPIARLAAAQAALR
ncbi:pyruvate, phosphate dikinase [Candidatus Peregrinibacteria bacterium CG11_big_fil_rev_8_21_14_0_20_46_8]|nr:MAG: pyruvate, phosphate dikinase [Candidatus Peregrinibacteria bacterium CG11_big_fil_rev_8_21_14_0_20_46_8]